MSGFSDIPALAPLYDVMSTVHYESVMTRDGLRPVSTRPAMRIAGIDDINRVTIDDLVSEATSWHYDGSRAPSHGVATAHVGCAMVRLGATV